MQVINCLKKNKFKVIVNQQEETFFINDKDLQEQFEEIAQFEFDNNYKSFTQYINNLRKIMNNA